MMEKGNPFHFEEDSYRFYDKKDKSIIIAKIKKRKKISQFNGDTQILWQ